VFLSDTHFLAVLTANNKPLLWRHSRLPCGDETSAILAAVRSLGSIGAQSGLDSQAEVVVIHGRADLRRLLDMDWVHQQVTGELQWLDGPALDNAEVARGLAEGCLDDEGGFDLARHHQTQRTLWQTFPWSEATMHVALIVAMALFLTYRLLLVQDELTAATMRNAQSEIASLTAQQLQKEKKDLKLQVSAVESFLDTRIVWTNYERELSRALPPDVFFTSIRGASEFTTSSKANAKPQKQLALKGAVAIPQDGLIPHEVDRLLNALRQNPLLKRDFPLIELADLKQFKRGDETLAMFTVIGLSKETKQ
jgi:Tfp pilus assembly protein PilN